MSTEDSELSVSFYKGLLSVSGDAKAELEKPLSEQDHPTALHFTQQGNNREQTGSSLFKSYMNLELTQHMIQYIMYNLQMTS